MFVDPDRVGDYPPLPQPGQSIPYGGSQPPQFPPELRDRPAREPEWTNKGTYMVVRASVVDHARWDDVPLGVQEQTIGRFKVSGASLDLDDRAEHPTVASSRRGGGLRVACLIGPNRLEGEGARGPAPVRSA